MARYIDADALIKTIFPFDGVDKRFYSINARAVYEAIKKAPTADAVPKSEVDELKADVEVWKQNRFNIFQRIECYDMTRKKVAREIFEEIKKPILSQLGISTMEKKEAYHYCLDVLDELKKKYTEEK